MIRHFHYEVMPRLITNGMTVFLGLMILMTVGGASENIECGAGNVSKLKYADPVKDIHLYLNAFHIAKNNPDFEIEAHHYCSMRNLDVTGEDIHQCVIYDSNVAPAKLLGIEYIVSDNIYQALPADDKKYWHPHAYEVISGQLIVPDLPDMGDDALEGYIKSWGKTFHTWPDPSTDVPLGEPLLMWSAGADGQISQKMIDKRDKQFDISSNDLRIRRQKYGYQVPTVEVPASINENGKLWSSKGSDTPKRLK